jgi:transketolase
MFRSIPGSTVFYPSDAVSCERAVELAANTPGVTFIRTSRPNTAILYDNNEPFAVGKAKVILSLKNQIKCFNSKLRQLGHKNDCTLC